MPENTRHRMKTNKTKNTAQKTKKITSTDARKNKAQNEDKQNKEHNTET
jgi:hypothetical protein